MPFNQERQDFRTPTIENEFSMTISKMKWLKEMSLREAKPMSSSSKSMPTQAWQPWQPDYCIFWRGYEAPISGIFI
jgi:hypothetical protein